MNTSFDRWSAQISKSKTFIDVSLKAQELETNGIIWNGHWNGSLSLSLSLSSPLSLSLSPLPLPNTLCLNGFQWVVNTIVIVFEAKLLYPLYLLYVLFVAIFGIFWS